MAQLNSLQTPEIETESSPLLLRRIYVHKDETTSRYRQSSSPVMAKSRWGTRPFLIASAIAGVVAVLVIITVLTARGSSSSEESSIKQSVVLRAANPGEGENGFEDIIADTPLGKVKGYLLQSREGREYYAFYKVPYAQPPLGDLRFKPPQPVKNWDETRDFDEVAPQCIQKVKYSPIIETAGEEDCLYMNIYTPKIPSADGEVFPLMPTLFYVHGGGFVDGNGSRYGGKYFMDEDVVLITFQYRLGPFGFLTTSDEDIMGNMGFKDQVMALNWTSQYIQHFGGDPNRVMIFGNSAGAMAVSNLMVSPLADGFFHSAITQSGGSLCIEMVSAEQAKATYEAVVEDSGCTSRSRRQVLKCLRDMNATDLAVIRRAPVNYYMVSESFLDESYLPQAFMPDTPYNLLKTGQVNKVPWLIGVNSAEFLASALVTLKMPEVVDELNTNWTAVAPEVVGMPHATETVVNASKTFYFGDNLIGNETERNLTNIISDLAFVFCSKAQAAFQSQHSSVYLYYLDKRPRKSYSDGALQGFPPGDYGTSHADELQYLFNYNGYPEYPPEDQEYFPFSRYLIKVWIHFAQTGKPSLLNITGSEAEWLRIQPKQQTPLVWMELSDNPHPTTILQGRLDFWDQFPIEDILNV